MNFLVVITTMVGYYMAGRGVANWPLMFNALLGTALTAAGASVLNQYIERDLDKRMPRTRNRPLPAGRVQPIEALAYGVGLGAVGVAYLAFLVNPLTAALGAITARHVSVRLHTNEASQFAHNTVIGAIPGAIPPMMGWTAATGVLSVEAIALFAILFIWQMPHFLAIAILYKNDYAAGGFKMLPNEDDENLSITSRQILVYGLAMIPVSVVPSVVGMAGAAYFTSRGAVECRVFELWNFGRRVANATRRPKAVFRFDHLPAVAFGGPDDRSNVRIWHCDLRFATC